ncbi:tyrosine-type recombinase/integrase [Escherichia coli]
MGDRKLAYTFIKNRIYFVQLLLPNNKLYRRSLATDSFREAASLMEQITPVIKQYKKSLLTFDVLDSYVKALITSSNTPTINNVLSIPVIVPSALSTFHAEPIKVVETKPILTLAQAWNDFKQWKISKGEIWNVEQAKKNERSFESLLALLGDDYNVYEITRKTMERVLEGIEGLPDARKPPYNKMSVKERLECDDIPEEQLIGASTYNAHIKIFSQFFNTYIVKEMELLERSPMEGVKQKKENSRYGVYTKAEIKKYINYALTGTDSVSMKWIILLLAYTGARRGEIARLKSTQVKFDEDCQRHYLHIAEDGTGKTENATREVVLHADLINYGFLDFLNGKEGYLFPDVANSTMNGFTQDFIAIRDELEIPALDKDGSRRTVHSLRHTFITYASGWMKDNTHLQTVIGHAKTGLGVTKRYIHTIPLESLLYVVDGIDWK